ncbi:MAG: peptidylprolyl isomerase [Saprospiraceae bacterium]|nr:peptidylprolyl isomerase [Saprospiraceae bacterium]MCB9324580.1 peptidylprolyl isomerase [Lewinellaceae bacterium]
MNRVFLLLIMLGLAVTGWGQREVIDKVVATVGGELVLLSDVEEQLALAKDQRGAMPEGARCEILTSIMVTKLLLNQAKLDSIEVAEEQVETQLDARIEQILAYMGGDVLQFEAYYGQSIDEVKDRFREDLRDQMLTEQMRNQIMTDISVTPSEVKAFFNKIPVDSLPYFNAEVEVGEIVYKPVVNEIERQKSIDQLTEIRRQIVEEGADFGEMAKKYSSDASGQVGGDLGWAKRGKYVAAFEAAAYKLEKDQVSPIVKSEFGYHLIQMLERRGNSIHVRHILLRPEITDEDMALAKAHLDTVRMLVQTDSISFSQAVKTYSEESAQSYNNDGRMVNQITGNTFFEIGDLDPDVYFALDTLDLGEVSAPFEYAVPPGDTYFRIVQLQSKTSPHKANLRQDYSKIKQAAIQSKQSEFINDWVLEKIEGTYIAVDAMYDGCPTLQGWNKHALRQ